MAKDLSFTTKIKLIIPVLYLCASICMFIVLWPQEPTANHFIGAIMTMLAFTLWLVARVQLGNAFSVSPEAKFLVTNGLYSKLRHPVYYFSILALAGIAIFLWSISAAIAVGALVLLEWHRIVQEEALLEKTFRKKYTNYKRSTWM